MLEVFVNQWKISVSDEIIEDFQLQIGDKKWQYTVTKWKIATEKVGGYYTGRIGTS